MSKNQSRVRLHDVYMEQIVPILMEKFAYKNIMEVPRVEKIVLNMGVGKATQDRKKVTGAFAEMALIAGQQPIITRAKKSEAIFKLREGMAIGCKVTLRRKQMYEFLDRLINIALPRVRDFRGLSPKAFDGSGNFNMGIKEQLIFPEIDYDKVDEIRGMNITICTSAKTNEEGLELLRGLNMPLNS